MKPLVILGIGVASGLTALLINFPLSWAINPFLTPEIIEKVQFSGTIWKGHIDPEIDYLPDIQIETNLKGLVGYAPLATFKSMGGPIVLTGQADIDRVNNVVFSAPLSLFSRQDPRFSDLQGTVNVSIDEIVFNKARTECVSASGALQTDVLPQSGAKWGWAGPKLSGPLSCEDGKVKLYLTGQERGESVAADIRVDLSGGYGASITVQSQVPEARAILPIYGFVIRGNQYELSESGRW